ncbi:acetyl-CoA hydrolase/transferase family protein [Bacteroidota bacterium]
MKVVKNVNEIVNSTNLKPGDVLYIQGNAATPQVLCNQLAQDDCIVDIDAISILLLGEIKELFSAEACRRIKHRIIFNGPHSREAMNDGRATYQLIHLSDVPRQIRECFKPDVVFIQVNGPDNGGNYSLGTTVEGTMSAIKSAKEKGGLILAECNSNMPFLLGTTIHESEIDFMIEVDYKLPHSPVHTPDERAMKIGEVIAELYIHDGTTLQYGLGEVPEAVSQAILKKGVKDLGIYTELLADSMRMLIDKEVVTNKYLTNNFSVGTIFLSGTEEGYQWLDFNSSVQSRPSDRTNNIMLIAAHPRMTAINAAIGVDLHGNIWADSLVARNIYSGIGGQADFLRGSYLADKGVPIIAMKSTTESGISKILNKCPEGITTTAIAADPVMIVTEYGAFNPMGLNISEHAVAIAHLAEPETREKLLREIYDCKEFHKTGAALKDSDPKGFTSYESLGLGG